MRLLMNPDPAPGGPPAHPDFGQPPAPTPTPTPPPTPPPGPAPVDTLTLPRSEVERLYGAQRAFDQLQAQQQAAIDAARLAAVQEEAARGAEERQAAIARLNQERAEEVAQLRNQWLASERGRTVSAALASPPTPYVSPHAAQQVQAIIEADTEATLAPDGTIRVVDRRTGRPAAEVIAERLASPEFAHFLTPASRGGSGGTAPGPAPGGGGPAPSLKEQILGGLRQRYGTTGG